MLYEGRNCTDRSAHGWRWCGSRSCSLRESFKSQNSVARVLAIVTLGRLYTDRPRDSFCTSLRRVDDLRESCHSRAAAAPVLCVVCDGYSCCTLLRRVDELRVVLSGSMLNVRPAWSPRNSTKKSTEKAYKKSEIRFDVEVGPGIDTSGRLCCASTAADGWRSGPAMLCCTAA